MLLPGVGLYVLWRRGRWMFTPWPYLGAGALLAIQAPTSSSPSRASASGPGSTPSARSRRCTSATAPSASSSSPNAWARPSHTLGLALGGLLNDRDTPPPPPWHPAALLALVLAILALAWLVRRRQPLIPLVVLSGLLLLPLVNGKYAPLVSNARYLMP